MSFNIGGAIASGIAGYQAGEEIAIARRQKQEQLTQQMKANQIAQQQAEFNMLQAKQKAPLELQSLQMQVSELEKQSIKKDVSSIIYAINSNNLDYAKRLMKESPKATHMLGFNDIKQNDDGGLMTRMSSINPMGQKTSTEFSAINTKNYEMAQILSGFSAEEQLRAKEKRQKIVEERKNAAEDRTYISDSKDRSIKHLMDNNREVVEDIIEKSLLKPEDTYLIDDKKLSGREILRRVQGNNVVPPKKATSINSSYSIMKLLSQNMTMLKNGTVTPAEIETGLRSALTDESEDILSGLLNGSIPFDKFLKMDIGGEVQKFIVNLKYINTMANKTGDSDVSTNLLTPSSYQSVEGSFNILGSIYDINKDIYNNTLDSIKMITPMDWINLQANHSTKDLDNAISYNNDDIRKSSETNTAKKPLQSKWIESIKKGVSNVPKSTSITDSFLNMFKDDEPKDEEDKEEETKEPVVVETPTPQTKVTTESFLKGLF